MKEERIRKPFKKEEKENNKEITHRGIDDKERDKRRDIKKSKEEEEEEASTEEGRTRREIQ